MPHSFSKEEQTYLCTKLLTTGKELFYQKGYKNTSVKDITEQVGIASGSFYSFFKSKEELFMKIYYEENNRELERIISSVDHNQDACNIISDIFFQLDSSIRPNTIMGNVQNMNDFLNIMSKLDPDQKAKAREESYKPFIQFILKWQEEGIIKQMAPDMILTLFDSIFFIKMHKTDIGEKYFPDCIKLLFEYVLNGILEKKGEKV